MKSFKEIIDFLLNHDLIIEYSNIDLHIEYITYDSREAKRGTLFFCKGVHFRKEYLLDAIESEALAYISETDYEVGIPKIIVKDIRKAMALLASFFYDYPDKKLKIIGVTGTKGKSTTVEFIKSIFDEYLLENNKKPMGIFSSIKIYDGMEEKSSKLTTPEALVLFEHLHNAVKSGIEYVVMEVSSQALKYDRVSELSLDVACFLNIGRDHISPNEHSDFEDYFKSKLKIIRLAENIIYNKDMEMVEIVEDEIKNLFKKNYSYSIKNKNADLFSIKNEYIGDRNTFTVDKSNYELNIFGEYNVENALCAIAVARHYNIEEKYIIRGLKAVKLVGRSNLFITKDKKIVFLVDYAHNDLSFKKVYNAILNTFTGYKIFSVFGASGEKALNRIEDLSTISVGYSDRIFLAPDDPGYVEISKIQQEMFQYIDTDNIPTKRFDSREEAIIAAYGEVKEKTVIFIAGKGEEEYQYINGDYVKIKSDLEVVKELWSQYNHDL